MLTLLTAAQVLERQHQSVRRSLRHLYLAAARAIRRLFHRRAPNESLESSKLPSPTSRRRNAGLRELVGAAAYVDVAGDDEEALVAAVTALQDTKGPTVVDLRALTSVPVALFEYLHRVWTADVLLTGASRRRGGVRQLAFVLSYDAWVLRSHRTTEMLRHLILADVDARMFYAQQFLGGYVRAWFETRLINHDLPAVLGWLRRHWRPADDDTRAAVLRATSKLVQERAPRALVPQLLLDLAQVAAASSSPHATDRAVQYLHLSLHWNGDQSSSVRCVALRALAGMWRDRGNVVLATRLLYQALDTALALSDKVSTIEVLSQLAGCAATAGQRALAEFFLRHALELSSEMDAAPTRATIHHALARVLLDQGTALREADHHARVALSLRGDPESPQALQDQVLRSQISERRKGAPAPTMTSPARAELWCRR